MEHSESSGALSEQGLIRKHEPNASAPSNSNNWNTLCSPLLLLASWERLRGNRIFSQFSDILFNKSMQNSKPQNDGMPQIFTYFNFLEHFKQNSETRDLDNLLAGKQRTKMTIRER